MQHNEVISVCVCWRREATTGTEPEMLIPPGCDNCFMTLYATRIRLVSLAGEKLRSELQLLYMAAHVHVCFWGI